MTVGELIQKLQGIDSSLEIISPKDDEGNGWRWPDRVSTNAFVPKNELGAWGIEDICSKEDFEEDVDRDDFVQVCYIG
jgi:hypothetical protein